MCFVRTSEQTATFSLYCLNRLAFITVVVSVYCAVCIETLYNTDMIRLWRVNSLAAVVENLAHWKYGSRLLFPFFLVWDLLRPHCGFRGLLLHLTALKHTHTHTHARARARAYKHTQPARLLWRSNSPVAEPSTLQNTAFARNRHPSPPAPPPAGIEPTIPGVKRPQTYALHLAAIVVRELYCCFISYTFGCIIHRLSPVQP